MRGYFASEINKLKNERSAVLTGGIIAAAVGAVIWVLFSGCECVWQLCIIPPAFPPRFVLLILNGLWNFILGALFSHILVSCGVSRAVRRKCLLDIALAMLFAYLWYPLLFAASVPILALAAVVGCMVFVVFALICRGIGDLFFTMLSVAAVIRCAYYVFAIITFIMLNYLIF